MECVSMYVSDEVGRSLSLDDDGTRHVRRRARGGAHSFCSFLTMRSTGLTVACRA
jgi:hypothetical protein